MKMERTSKVGDAHGVACLHRSLADGTLVTFMATALHDQVLRQALGYIRVSTEEQATDGHGLEHQTQAIRDYAERRGYVVLGIYEDVGTAKGPDSWLKREGLQQVLSEARRQGVPIIANDASRITRHAETHQQLHSDPTLNLLYTDDELPSRLPGRSLDVAVINEQRLKNIAAGTRKGMADKAAEGVTFGRSDKLVSGRKRSQEIRRQKADRAVEDIGHYLQRNPAAETWTARRLVDALNAEGLRSGRGLPWTLEGIRRPLSSARKEFALWKELEALPDDAKIGSGSAGDACRGANDASENFSAIPRWGMF